MSRLKWLTALAIFCWMVSIVLLSIMARAHGEWTSLHDPTTNQSCCGGTDCAQVPQELIDSGAVTPVADGFDVRLTVEQARHFNKSTQQPINQHIPWARVLPDQAKDPNGTGYALCIVASAIQCFFSPMGY